jgi:hypothetical protein
MDAQTLTSVPIRYPNRTVLGLLAKKVCSHKRFEPRTLLSFWRHVGGGQRTRDLVLADPEKLLPVVIVPEVLHTLGTGQTYEENLKSFIMRTYVGWWMERMTTH